ncbi:MAG: hypothetical protein J2P21_18660 [Chloracidobacterium sp.]|nr:hypothetical protein [Chloracidobacterium sp.]
MPAYLIPAPSGLSERLAALRVDLGRALRDAGSRSHASRSARLTTREFFAFWRAVEQAGAIGTRPAAGGEALLAALQAPNLGAALKILARYKRLGETTPPETRSDRRTPYALRFRLRPSIHTIESRVMTAVMLLT